MDANFFKLQEDNTSLDYLNNQLENLKLCAYKSIIINDLLDKNPDLASFFIYGDSSYYWILLYVNDLDSFEDFKKGLKIKCPIIKDLQNCFASL